MNLHAIIGGGLSAVYDYVFAHTLFCLVPAFFIAGAMASFIPKSLLLPYLGKKSPKHVAYPLSVISGLLLAVCSCTVLPLFAGIRKSGAGIGPAIAFLYTAPATNIVAILYTGSLIGWDVAFARIMFSVLFAVSIGIAISYMFREDEESEDVDVFKKQEVDFDFRRVAYLFGLLVSILIVGTRVNVLWIKYAVVSVLVIALIILAKTLFNKEEVRDWLRETLGFAKTIAPLLLVGVFTSGVIRVLMPQGFVTDYVGDNSMRAVLIPVIFGVLVYFPTLVEVPMAKTFIDLGMARGPLLAYLLSDPVLSLPSILVVGRLMGVRKTAVYVSLIIVCTVFAGVLYGRYCG